MRLVQFIFFCFLYSVSIAQNSDTLVLPIGEGVVFFEPENNTYTFLSDSSNFNSFFDQQTDSLKKYNITYQLTRCRYILFPFERKNAEGESRKFIIDRQNWGLLNKIDPEYESKMKLGGVIWYNNLNEFHWSIKHKLFIDIKSFFKSIRIK